MDAIVVRRNAFDLTEIAVRTKEMPSDVTSPTIPVPTIPQKLKTMGWQRVAVFFKSRNATGLAGVRSEADGLGEVGICEDGAFPLVRPRHPAAEATQRKPYSRLASPLASFVQVKRTPSTSRIVGTAINVNGTANDGIANDGIADRLSHFLPFQTTSESSASHSADNIPEAYCSPPSTFNVMFNET